MQGDGDGHTAVPRGDTEVAPGDHGVGVASRGDTEVAPGERGHGADEPLLSVVIPVHNVAPYLAECLDSVLAQDVDDLEVWCIDDGSTDHSADIAARYAERDPRLHLVRQANAGLGATRNRGAELATGRYLAFLDSDDLVPPRAYQRMLAAIEGSGSDLVTGDIRRLTSVGLRPSPTFSPLYHPARSATHVTRDHALLQDRIAPNKLYRRAFWVEQGLAFPTGVLHEDIAVVLRAHVLARQVEVLDQVVYVWRIRQGVDRSITQRRLEERALVDRVAAVSEVSALLAERDLTELRRAYDHRVLTDDLVLHAQLLDRADPAYVERFMTEARGFLQRAAAGALEEASAFERLRWYLIDRGDAEGVVTLARHHHIDPAGRPAQRRGRGGRERLVADLPTEQVRTRVPRRLHRMDAEVSLVTGVTGLAFDGHRLVIDGFAALSHGDTVASGDQELRLWVKDLGSGTTLELPVVPEPRPEASRPPPRVHDRRGGGFRARLDLTALTSRWERGTTRWRLHAEVRAAGLVRRGPVAGVATGPPRRPPTREIGRLRVGARVDQDALDVVVASRPVRLVAAVVVEGQLELTLDSRRQLTGLRMTTPAGEDREVAVTPVDPAQHEAGVSGPAQRAAAAPDGSLWRARVDPVALASSVGVDAPRSVTLQAVDERGRTARLSADHGVEHAIVAVVRGAVALEISRYGYASLVCSPPVVHVDGAEVAGARATLVARTVGADARRLRAGLVARDRHDPRELTVELVSDDRVRLHIDPAALTRSRGVHELSVRLLPPGVVGSAPEDTDGVPEARVRTTRRLTTSLPVPLPGTLLPTTLTDRSWHRLAVEVTDDLAPDERTRGEQRRLWAEVTGTDPAPRPTGGLGARVTRGGGGAGPRRPATGRQRPPARELTDGIVVLAGGGRSTGGCPRAVAEALHHADPELPLWWAVDQRSIEPPAWATPVAVGSRAWLEVLARARGIVADSPLPEAMVRARDQRVVRCWDGTPVRPVGGRGPGVRGAEQPADAHRAWSHLVAAGDHAAEVLTDAFQLGVDGGIELLAVGLPRHDVLTDTAARAARRAGARAALGVGAADQLVVHLPTWADGARHPGGRLRRIDDLDLRDVARRVRSAVERGSGGGRAHLAVRAHPAVVDTFAELDGEPGVTDVRGDVEVTDLLLAADVVLAHHSSVVLEASRVGVPVVLHEPTGHGLASQLGAPSLDLIATARPARVTTTPTEAVAALRELLSASASSRGGAAGHDAPQAGVVGPAAAQPGAGGPGAAGAGDTGATRHLEVGQGQAAQRVAEVLLG